MVPTQLWSRIPITVIQNRSRIFHGLQERESSNNFLILCSPPCHNILLPAVPLLSKPFQLAKKMAAFSNWNDATELANWPKRAKPLQSKVEIRYIWETHGTHIQKEGGTGLIVFYIFLRTTIFPNNMQICIHRLNMLAMARQWSPFKGGDMWAGQTNKQELFCPGFILIAAVELKITKMQQKAQEKFAKTRDCLSFASVKH